MVLQGPLQATSGGRIDGTVSGDIHVDGLLVIGKAGRIKGNVYASRLNVLGKVYGDIFCDDKAIIYNTAVIKGDITAKIIEVKEGAEIEGVIMKKAPKEPEKAGQPEEEASLDAAPEEEAVAESPREISTEQDRDATNWF